MSLSQKGVANLFAWTTAMLSTLFVIPHVCFAAPPSGAVKLPKAKLIRQAGYYCGNVQRGKWLPGRLVSGGYFYSHKAESKTLSKQLRSASKKTAIRLLTRIAKLKKLITSRAKSCDSYSNPTPEAATSLGWLESSPSEATAITASWTRSVATDLANQKIQLFSDASCTTASGSLIDLASASTQMYSFIGSDGATYTYNINSIDTEGNSSMSACSSALAIQIQPLTISPAVAVVHPHRTSQLSFTATGGDGSKTFAVASGTGSINPMTGLYSVVSHVPNGVSTIQVADSANPASTKTARLFQVAALFNNTVYAIAEHNGYGYFGGSFTEYNPHVMNGLGALDLTTGDLIEGCNFAGLLNSGDSVSAVVATSTDLFVGGALSSYAGEPVQNLIKINKQACELDTTFSHSTGTNSYVNALAISGGSLYVGGYFTSYRGVVANYLAKVDLGSGELDTTFTQSTGLDDAAHALVVSGSSLYVGGQFSTYRGAPARYLAKVNLTSGNLDTTFTQGTGADSDVYALEVSGSSLYLGGYFSSYRGAPAQSLAKIDLTSGNLDTTFTQNTGTDDSVAALAVSGSSLYVGGDFSSYRGTPAQSLVKVDLSSGDLDTTFTQNTGVVGGVNDLAISGSSLYVGGFFSAYRGVPGKNLAKVDLSSGDLDTTFTKSTGTNSYVSALVISGNSLYAGGGFNTYRGTTAPGLAKVDLSTGALDTTFTQSTGTNDLVRVLVVSGSSLYMGGEFTTYRGDPASHLAKVDLTNGALDTTFTQSTGTDGSVYALTASGSALYVGGLFSLYRGTPATGLAKVNLISGDLDTTFTQSTGTNGYVKALVISENSLYVGGAFTTYRADPANYLAKVDLTSGILDATFTQNSGVQGSYVGALVVAGGSLGNSLYVGGRFSSYRGVSANNLAKVDLTTGDLDTNFTQSAGTNDDVLTLAASGSSVYAGGAFTTYRGVAANHLAKVDLTSGGLDTTFTKTTGTNSVVYALAASGSTLYVGGLFTIYRESAPLGTTLTCMGVDLSSGDRTF